MGTLRLAICETFVNFFKVGDKAEIIVKFTDVEQIGDYFIDFHFREGEDFYSKMKVQISGFDAYYYAQEVTEYDFGYTIMNKELIPEDIGWMTGNLMGKLTSNRAITVGYIPADFPWGESKLLSSRAKSMADEITHTIESPSITFLKDVIGDFDLTVGDEVGGEFPTGSVAIAGDDVAMSVDWFTQATVTVSSLTVDGATEVTVTPTGIQIGDKVHTGATKLVVSENVVLKYEGTQASKDISQVAVTVTQTGVTVTLDNSFKEATTEKTITIATQGDVTNVNVKSPNNKLIKTEGSGIKVNSGGGGGGDGWVVPVVVVIVVLVVAAGCVGGFLFWRKMKNDDDETQRA